MKGQQTSQLTSVLRRERFAGVWLAFILLLVPFLQPLAEANAAGKPFAAEICTTFGQPGKAAIAGLADDCGNCISGHARPVSVIPADEWASAWLHLLEVAGPADFPSPLTRTDAADVWWMKPPAQGPPAIV